MTPHGSSTSPGKRIPDARNPYEELAAPGAGNDGQATRGPNPYEELAADRDDGMHIPSPDATGEADDGLLGQALRPDEPDDAVDEMPYLRAVRRRRRSRLRMTVKLGIAFCVLLAFLAVCDRWAALYAENKAADKIQQAAKLHAQPEVHINGFPFLTQLAGERFDEVDVAIPDMAAGRVSAQVSGSVRDIKIVGDGPTAIKGAVLGRMKGHVLLDYDDLDRELGTSQVKFTPGKGNHVLALGELPVAGKKVEVRARAHVERTSDHGVGTTVDRMRLDVPGLFSFTPGKEGGLRLARPLAEQVQRDTAKAKALFRVGAVAERFGLTPQRARELRENEAKLSRLTGRPQFLDRMMKVNMLDAAQENPEMLKKVGVDPAMLDAVKNLRMPKIADRLSLNVNLPKMPGDIRLERVSVEKEGIRAELSGRGIPFGEAGQQKTATVG